MNRIREQKKVCKIANELVAVANHHQVDLMFMPPGVMLTGWTGRHEVGEILERMNQTIAGKTALVLIRNTLATGTVRIEDIDRIVPFRDGYAIGLTPAAHDRLKGDVDAGNTSLGDNMEILD
jgi:hypothetical protein